MKNEFKIRDRVVGDGHPPLVIAELGINHEGKLNVAKEIALSASRAGAEVLKHQTHVVEDEMSWHAKSVVPGNSEVSIYEIMERCALDEEEEQELASYVESLGMIFISTPFSRAAVDRLERMSVPAYKIGSGECNNIPLIEYIASKGKPIILSTGMNDLNSVAASVEAITKYNVPLALMHTTNLYPTPNRLVRLGAMQEMMEKFPHLQVGLSDHTTGNLACLAAVALGANILERHFVDTRDREGPDVQCSMNEADLAALISDSMQVTEMRGGNKVASNEEKITIEFAFASVVASTAIKAGEKFTDANIWVKRPSGGIPAAQYFGLIGRIASVDIESGAQVSWGMVV